MKTLLILLMFTGFCYGQKVDILDKNRKVIKTAPESDLQRVIDSIGYKARYTSRWVENKPVECRIEKVKNIVI